MQNDVNMSNTLHGKRNVPELQNPNRANVNATKTLEETSLWLPGDAATP